jgi:hypothetical protein
MNFLVEERSHQVYTTRIADEYDVVDKHFRLYVKVENRPVRVDYKF